MLQTFLFGGIADIASEIVAMLGELIALFYLLTAVTIQSALNLQNANENMWTDTATALDGLESTFKTITELFSLPNNSLINSDHVTFNIGINSWGNFMIAVGLSICGLFMVTNLFRAFFGKFQETEEPAKIVIRGVIYMVIVSIFYQFAGFIIGQIFSPLYKDFTDKGRLSVLDAMGNLAFNTFINGSFALVSAGYSKLGHPLALTNWTGPLISSIIFLILNGVLFKKFLVLAIEIIERYIVVFLLTLFGPICVAFGSNKATEQVVSRYIGAFISGLVLLIFSVIFIYSFIIGFVNYTGAFTGNGSNLAGEAVGAVTGNGDESRLLDSPFVYFVLLYGWLRAGTQIDEYMQTLGFTAIRTGMTASDLVAAFSGRGGGSGGAFGGRLGGFLGGAAKAAGAAALGSQIPGLAKAGKLSPNMASALQKASTNIANGRPIGQSLGQAFGSSFSKSGAQALHEAAHMGGEINHKERAAAEAACRQVVPGFELNNLDRQPGAKGGLVAKGVDGEGNPCEIALNEDKNSLNKDKGCSAIAVDDTQMFAQCLNGSAATEAAVNGTGAVNGEELAEAMADAMESVTPPQESPVGDEKNTGTPNGMATAFDENNTPYHIATNQDGAMVRCNDKGQADANGSYFKCTDGSKVDANSLKQTQVPVCDANGNQLLDSAGKPMTQNSGVVAAFDAPGSMAYGADGRFHDLGKTADNKGYDTTRYTADGAVSKDGGYMKDSSGQLFQCQQYTGPGAGSNPYSTYNKSVTADPSRVNTQVANGGTLIPNSVNNALANMSSKAVVVNADGSLRSARATDTHAETRSKSGYVSSGSNSYMTSGKHTTGSLVTQSGNTLTVTGANGQSVTLAAGSQAANAVLKTATAVGNSGNAYTSMSSVVAPDSRGQYNINGKSYSASSLMSTFGSSNVQFCDNGSGGKVAVLSSAVTGGQVTSQVATNTRQQATSVASASSDGSTLSTASGDWTRVGSSGNTYRDGNGNIGTYDGNNITQNVMTGTRTMNSQVADASTMSIAADGSTISAGSYAYTSQGNGIYTRDGDSNGIYELQGSGDNATLCKTGELVGSQGQVTSNDNGQTVMCNGETYTRQDDGSYSNGVNSFAVNGTATDENGNLDFSNSTLMQTTEQFDIAKETDNGYEAVEEAIKEGFNMVDGNAYIVADADNYDISTIGEVYGDCVAINSNNRDCFDIQGSVMSEKSAALADDVVIEAANNNDSHYKFFNDLKSKEMEDCMKDPDTQRRAMEDKDGRTIYALYNPKGF